MTGLTPERLAAMEAAHVRFVCVAGCEHPHCNICDECSLNWPCDMRLLLDEVKRLCAIEDAARDVMNSQSHGEEVAAYQILSMRLREGRS